MSKESSLIQLRKYVDSLECEQTRNFLHGHIDTAIIELPQKVYTCNVYRGGKVCGSYFASGEGAVGDFYDGMLKSAKDESEDATIGDFRRVE